MLVFAAPRLCRIAAIATEPDTIIVSVADVTLALPEMPTPADMDTPPFDWTETIVPASNNVEAIEDVCFALTIVMPPVMAAALAMLDVFAACVAATVPALPLATLAEILDVLAAATLTMEPATETPELTTEVFFCCSEDIPPCTAFAALMTEVLAVCVAAIPPLMTFEPVIAVVFAFWVLASVPLIAFAAAMAELFAACVAATVPAVPVKTDAFMTDVFAT
jgi:hypothetical protein